MYRITVNGGTIDEVADYAGACTTALACARLVTILGRSDEITITWVDGEVSIDLFIEGDVVVDAAGDPVWPLERGTR
jgi:hypothetical protein